MPRMRAAVVGVAVMLAATSARADIVPDGAKGIRMTVLAEGKLPRGKELFVGHTWDGPTAIVPGEVSRPLQWHPLSGGLYLFVEDAEHRWSCSEPFLGYRMIRGTSPADEVRFVFALKFKQDECTATLVREEFLNARGEVVEPGNLSIDDLPLFAEVEEKEKAKDLLSVPDEKKAAPTEVKAMPTPRELLEQETPAAIQAQGCQCGATSAGGGWALMLGGILGSIRRRRG